MVPASRQGAVGKDRKKQKRLGCIPKPLQELVIRSRWKFVRPRLLLTRRLRTDRRKRIAVREGRAAGGTDNRVLQIWRYVTLSNRCSSVLLLLQGPLLNGAVDLAQVVDASVHLRCCASPDKVGNRDRSKQADDGYDDHDLNECKGCSF